MFRIAVATVLVTVLIACGLGMDPEGSGSGMDAGKAPRPEPVRASARIGPAGGTVTLLVGPAKGAKISIPAGALTAMVTVTVAAFDGAPVRLSSDVVVTGPAVSFGPANQKLARPVTIALPAARGSNMVYMRVATAGPWVKESVVRYDSAQRAIVAEVTHFATGFPAGGETRVPAVGYLLGLQDPTHAPAQKTIPPSYIRALKCEALCPATLIHPRIAITAGHCIKKLKDLRSKNLGGFEAALGFGNICEGDDQKTHVALNFGDIMCPDYNRGIPLATDLPNQKFTATNPMMKHYLSVHRVRRAVMLPQYAKSLITASPSPNSIVASYAYDVGFLFLESSVDDVMPVTYEKSTVEPNHTVNNMPVISGLVVGYGGDYGAQVRLSSAQYILPSQYQKGTDPGYLAGYTLDRYVPREVTTGSPFFPNNPASLDKIVPNILGILVASDDKGTQSYRVHYANIDMNHGYIEGYVKVDAERPDPDCSRFTIE